MTISRRDFLKKTTAGITAGLIVGSGCGGGNGDKQPDSGSPDGSTGLDSGARDTGIPDGGTRRPNILILMMDQMRSPPTGYAANQGQPTALREILGFANTISSNNAYSAYFPGLLRLRKNAVVLRNHYIASAACSPSRTSIFTGHYPSLHRVSQTDGMFKPSTDPNFHLLDPAGVPTVGDWFRAAGYTTHYFGKWHISEPTDGNLNPWGFSEWEDSAPEPHGSDPNNLGIYRDLGFANLVVNFLTQRAAGAAAPWLAVGSLLNPHDIVGYPQPWYTSVQMPPTIMPRPRPIPAMGDTTTASDMTVIPLNPDNFPQNNFSPSPTEMESLTTKPTCQYDYAIKCGMALKQQWPAQIQGISPMPFQLQGNQSAEWALKYNQFYTYLHYAADLQLRRIMQALDSSGVVNDTIVIFFSDHGEAAGSHGGMIQKWHQAYEETIHVPFVVSSPRINANATQVREVTSVTSHIDIAPTLLGLAGFAQSEVSQIKASITGHSPVVDFVGADLSPLIRGDVGATVRAPDGSVRQGVLFVTDDEFTEPVEGSTPPANYTTFLQDVENVKMQGVNIQSGPVVQPNHVQCLRVPGWKYVRYFDPDGVAPDQWELYALDKDPNEATNLVTWQNGQPVVRTSAIPVGWNLSATDVETKQAELHALLTAQTTAMLKRP